MCIFESLTGFQQPIGLGISSFSDDLGEIDDIAFRTKQESVRLTTITVQSVILSSRNCQGRIIDRKGVAEILRKAILPHWYNDKEVPSDVVVGCQFYDHWRRANQKAPLLHLPRMNLWKSRTALAKDIPDDFRAILVRAGIEYQETHCQLSPTYLSLPPLDHSRFIDVPVTCEAFCGKNMT